METSVNNKYKAFTSLEQSKKLAKILPIESADMYYYKDCVHAIMSAYHPNIVIPSFGVRNMPNYGEGDIPCWGLAALLSVLPDYTLQTNTDGTIFVVCDSKKPMISDAYDNPVDACVEMILKLNELNLL